MKFFKLSPIFLLIITALCGCDIKAAKYFKGRPNKAFNKDLEAASPEFQQGWQDGCEVGMSAGSNTFYKMFYRNNVVDGYKMTSSGDYKTAWGNAFWFCYRHDYIKQKSSIWGSSFVGYR